MAASLRHVAVRHAAHPYIIYHVTPYHVVKVWEKGRLISQKACCTSYGSATSYILSSLDISLDALDASDNDNDNVTIIDALKRMGCKLKLPRKRGHTIGYRTPSLGRSPDLSEPPCSTQVAQ